MATDIRNLTVDEIWGQYETGMVQGMADSEATRRAMPRHPWWIPDLALRMGVKTWECYSDEE